MVVPWNEWNGSYMGLNASSTNSRTIDSTNSMASLTEMPMTLASFPIPSLKFGVRRIPSSVLLVFPHVLLHPDAGMSYPFRLPEVPHLLYD